MITKTTTTEGDDPTRVMVTDREFQLLNGVCDVTNKRGPLAKLFEIELGEIILEATGVKHISEYVHRRNV